MDIAIIPLVELGLIVANKLLKLRSENKEEKSAIDYNAFLGEVSKQVEKTVHESSKTIVGKIESDKLEQLDVKTRLIINSFCK